MLCQMVAVWEKGQQIKVHRITQQRDEGQVLLPTDRQERPLS